MKFQEKIFLDTLPPLRHRLIVFFCDQRIKIPVISVNDHFVLEQFLYFLNGRVTQLII